MLGSAVGEMCPKLEYASEMERGMSCAIFLLVKLFSGEDKKQKKKWIIYLVTAIQPSSPLSGLIILSPKFLIVERGFFRSKTDF